MLQMSFARSLRMVSLLVAVSVVTGGCASAGHEKGMQTATQLGSSAARVEAARAQMTSTLASLKQLMDSPKPDPRDHYKSFSAGVDKLNGMSGDVGKLSDDMSRNAGDYFAKWNEDLAKIKNEDIRQTSQAIRDARQAEYAKMVAGYQAAKTQFSLFMADLTDIQTALKSDRFLVIAHGTAQEVTKAKSILMTAGASKADIHSGPQSEFII